jgi:hypothetical protein
LSQFWRTTTASIDSERTLSTKRARWKAIWASLGL